MNGLWLGTVLVMSFWFFGDSWTSMFAHGPYDNLFLRLNQP